MLFTFLLKCIVDLLCHFQVSAKRFSNICVNIFLHIHQTFIRYELSPKIAGKKDLSFSFCEGFQDLVEEKMIEIIHCDSLRPRFPGFHQELKKRAWIRSEGICQGDWGRHSRSQWAVFIAFSGNPSPLMSWRSGSLISPDSWSNISPTALQARQYREHWECLINKERGGGEKREENATPPRVSVQPLETGPSALCQVAPLSTWLHLKSCLDTDSSPSRLLCLQCF